VINNIPNERVRGSKSFRHGSYFFAIGIIITNLIGLGVAQFCKVLTFSLRICLSMDVLSVTTLPNHVQRILPLCSRKQMVWINTSRIVAMMANRKICFNDSASHFKRNSVGIFRPSVNSKKAIASASFAACPIPANANVLLLVWPRAIFINLFKKPFRVFLIKVEPFIVSGYDFGSRIRVHSMNVVSGFAVLNTSPNRV